jgi:hypothetical protein
MLDKLEWFRTKAKGNKSRVRSSITVRRITSGRKPQGNAECRTNWNGFVPRPRVTRAEYVHQSRYDELLVAAALKEMRNAGQYGMDTERPFCANIATPVTSNLLRIVNTATVQFHS